MQIVILCGGSGTRLWPLSRSLYPKQFVKLFGQESLFQKTVTRNRELADSFSVIINQEQFFMGHDQFEETKTKKKISFILEPMGKNTAPAIALAALNAHPDEILLVVPSDHLIENQKAYVESVKAAEDFAKKDKLVTFGIKPTYAETGYGYIESKGFDVTSFKEKPDAKTAESYLKAGNYLWNSGMFCFRAGAFLDELKKHAPDIHQQSVAAFQSALKGDAVRVLPEAMSAIRSESIDYAVMERSKEVKVIPADIGWSDLGSFDSIYDALPRDEHGNTQTENVIHIGSKNNLVIGGQRLISTIDVSELMIVDTPDALVVAKKGSTQKVKDLVAEVKKKNANMTNFHTTSHRPWGTHALLQDGEGYRVNQMTVRPGAKLSLQKHQQRSEHWIVLKGTATVTIDGKITEVKQNESTFIPKGSEHRLENRETEELILIEAQVGQYSDDDIIRLQDDYKRI